MGKNFKSVIAASVAISAVAPLVPVANAQDVFSDVKENNSHYSSILELAERKIISGYPDGTFKPGNSVTRGQAAKIIARILELDTTNNTTSFSDVSAAYEHAGAINALYKEGIISGYADGTFKPGNPITRAQMAKILVNAFKLQQLDATHLPFTDVNKSGEFAPYIQALFDNNITKGTTTTTYSPLANVTRGQLATFVVGAEKAVKATAFTIERIENGTVYTTKGSFKVSNKLATIFGAENANALKGASVTVKVINGTFESVSAIELNEAGTELATVNFNGGGIVLDQLTINADYVKVENTEVTGNVIVGANAKSALSFVATTVKGQVKVESAPKTAFASLSTTVPNAFVIHAVNSAFAKYNIHRDAVVINSDKEIVELIVNESVKQLQLNAAVQKLAVGKSDALAITGNGKLNTVEVGEAKGLKLDLPTHIAKLIVTSLNAKIDLGAKTTVEVAVIPDNVKLTDLMPQSASKVKGSMSASEAAAGGQPTPTQQTTLPSTGIGSYIPPVVQVTIAKVNDVEIYLGYKQPFDLATDLPKEVEATMSDNSKKQVAITWTVPEDVKFDHSVNGELKLEGTITGYTPKVNLTIKVGPAKIDTLKAKIEAAKTLAVTKASATGDDVLPTEKWATEEVIATLKAAIVAAEKAASTEKLSYQEVTNAEKALEEAVKSFEATLKDGITIDTTAAKIKITALLAEEIIVAEKEEDVEYGQNYATAVQKVALDEAVAAANKVLADADDKKITKVTYDKEMVKFQAAIDVFAAAYLANKGTKVDKQLLGSLMTTVKATVVSTISVNGKDILPSVKWTTKEAKEAIQDAIVQAQAELDSKTSSPQSVNNAQEALTAAFTTYKGEIKDGIKPATAAATAKITNVNSKFATLILEDSAASVAYGKNYITTAQKAAIEEAITHIEEAIVKATNNELTANAYEAAVAAFDVEVAAFEAAAAEQKGTYVDKSVLTTTLAEAVKANVKVSVDGTDVPGSIYWVTEAQFDEFNQAITNAKTISEKDDASDVEVQTAIEHLKAAFELFEREKQLGKVIDTTKLVDLIAEANRLFVIVGDKAEDVAPGQAWTTQTEKDKLEAAITEATAILSLSTVAQTDLEKAMKALSDEIATYKEAAKKVGAPVDVVNLNALLAQVAYVAVSKDGTDISSSTKWTTEAAKLALEEVEKKANDFIDKLTTKTALTAIEAELTAAVEQYGAAQKPGLKTTLLISTYSVELTSSEALDISVDGAVVGTATLGEAATGEYELSFAPSGNEPFNLTKLGKEFSFKLDQVTFIVKNDGKWQVSAKPLGKPANVQVVNGSTIEVKWDAVTEAAEYEVTRIAQDGTATLLGKVATPSFSDTSTIMGEMYAYIVKAQNKYTESVTSDKTTLAKARLDVEGPIYTGDYVVISNESTDYMARQTTGKLPTTSKTITTNSLKAANATDSYRINPVLGTDIRTPIQNFTSDKVTLNSLNTAQPTSYKVGQERTFKVQNLLIRGFEDLNTKLLATASGVNIWVGDTNITAEMAQQIADEFEANMFNLVTSKFTKLESDVDGNSKVDIVIFDIQDGYDGVANRGYLGGYYNQGDLYSKENVTNSNEGEILYIDTYPLMSADKKTFDPQKAYTTIVHEFQHLVNYAYESKQVIHPTSAPYGASTATWLDEGMALAAEQMYLELKGEAAYLNDRIRQYDSGVFGPDFSIINWDENLDANGYRRDLENYAMAYLFVQYIKIQSGKGDDVFKEILLHEESLKGEEISQEAVDAISDVEAVKAIEKVMGIPFGEVMTNFRIALVAQEAEGVYGFKGQMKSLKLNMYNGSATNLRGGAAIVVNAHSKEVDSSEAGDNVKYTGIYTTKK